MSYSFNPNVKNIVIAHPSRKDFYLRKKAEDPYLDLVVMTLPEMKALFDYNYDDRALRFLLGKGIPYLVAKDLLKAFAAPHFENGEEVKKYADLREGLIKEHLLFKTAYPERTFIGSHILISGYYREASIISEYLGSLSGKMEIDFEIEEYQSSVERIVNKFLDPYEELHFVYNKIAYDIDANKTPIDKIYVYGLTSDYAPLVHEFNKAYGFSIDLSVKERLYDTGVYKTFRKAFEDKGLEDSITLMREKYPDSKDADTIERFAREFAVVFEKDRAKTVSIYDDIAKEKEAFEKKRKNVIQVLQEPVCPLDGHLYCVNFAMGQYPSVASESGLFNDKEKKLIGLPTSKDISLGESERIEKLVSSANVKLITFFELGFESHHFLSGFAEKYQMKVVDSPIAEDENGPYEYAHDKGAFLYATMQDEYENYLQDDKRRKPYEDIADPKDYRKYDYEFTGKSTKRSTKRSYSASGLTTYRSCPFKYLMDKIIHANDEPSAFVQRIGNVFHKTLEMSHTNPDIDFDKAYSMSMEMEQGLIKDPDAHPHEEEKIPFTVKEKALMENLRSYCRSSLEFQKLYEEKLQNPKYMAEGQFDISLGDYGVNGRYDKVITFDYNGGKYAFIIDYKTGSTSFDEALFNSPHGLSLQLPLYAFAIENEKAAFDNAKIAGLFISPVLPYKLTNKERKPIQKLDQNELRLNGLFLNDLSFLRTIEPGLTDFSEIFAGCSVKSPGVLYPHGGGCPKFKTESQFSELAKRIQDIVKESDEAIQNGKFDIKPTVVKSKHDACNNCPFHDVCFVDKKKIVIENLSKSNMNPDLDDDDVEEEEESNDGE